MNEAEAVRSILADELDKIDGCHASSVIDCAQRAAQLLEELAGLRKAMAAHGKEPVPMLLHCPMCGARHVDVALANKSHHTHACQSCGHCWRPAIVPTVGVQFLPGFKDEVA